MLSPAARSVFDTAVSTEGSGDFQEGDVVGGIFRASLTVQPAAGLLSELEAWRAQRPRLDLGSRRDVELAEEVGEELRAFGYVD